jgi:hypothetical protein
VLFPPCDGTVGTSWRWNGKWRQVSELVGGERKAVGWRGKRWGGEERRVSEIVSSVVFMGFGHVLV